MGWVLQRNHCPAGRGGSTPMNRAGTTLVRQRLPEWLEPMADEERLREWRLLSWELSSLCRGSLVFPGGAGQQDKKQRGQVGSKGNSHRILGKTCHREREGSSLGNTQPLAGVAQSCPVCANLCCVPVGPDPPSPPSAALLQLLGTIVCALLPSLCQGCQINLHLSCVWQPDGRQLPLPGPCSCWCGSWAAPR